jgi:predicted alpha/beta-hydrolase family hydrolase
MMQRDAMQQFPNRKVYLIGKSMGSRMGLHASLEAEVASVVRGCICLGYPLVGGTGGVRSEGLCALRVPVLFVQGTRDKMCPLDELREWQGKMKAAHQLHVVEGGDHSLIVPKRGLLTQAAADAKVLEVIRGFVANTPSPSS